MSTFTCGHMLSGAPRNMGRGAARVKRLAVYFNRPCQVCLAASIRSDMLSYTDLQGNPNPASETQIQQRLLKLTHTY